MTIDTIQNVVEEFVKRLQLPESEYSFLVSSSNNIVELVIFVNGVMNCSLSIGNGTLRVIYDDKYESDKYAIINFITPITLVYYLCVFFYKAVLMNSELSFNDILSVVFFNDVYDWKTLLKAISEDVGLTFYETDKGIEIEGVEVKYNGFVNKIKIDNQEISLKDSSYTTVVEAMFKCVEYVANLNDTADNLFMEEEEPEIEESNLLEDEEGSEANIDMDIDVGGGEEEVESEPVPVVENEDFSEPQGPVVTVEDVM